MGHTVYRVVFQNFICIKPICILYTVYGVIVVSWSLLLSWKRTKIITKITTMNYSAINNNNYTIQIVFVTCKFLNMEFIVNKCLSK